MAGSLNQVVLIGRLGRDAETKFTPGGTPVTKFSLATDRKWKDKQSGEWKTETEWTDVTLWSAEKLAAYLTKGKQVSVVGRLKTESWEKDGQKHYRTGVVAENVILLGGRDDSVGPSSGISKDMERRGYGGAQNDGPIPPISDDDVPF